MRALLKSSSQGTKPRISLTCILQWNTSFLSLRSRATHTDAMFGAKCLIIIATSTNEAHPLDTALNAKRCMSTAEGSAKAIKPQSTAFDVVQHMDCSSACLVYHYAPRTPPRRPQYCIMLSLGQYKAVGYELFQKRITPSRNADASESHHPSQFLMSLCHGSMVSKQ